jgi:MFS family permease
MDIRHLHKKIFYGWWIVAACFFISMYVSGSITLGFTALFEPIVQEFGWSYTQVAFAASLRGIESGIFAPLVGLLVDRWGARKLLFGGAVLIGFAMLLLSRVNSLAMFYWVFIMIGMGTSTCLGVVPVAAVSNWFQRKMPLAVGIVVSGTGAGGLLLPLLSKLIDILQWRTVVAIFGAGTWCIVLPLALLVRHKPEQYGYSPDGISTPVEVNVAGKTESREGKKSITNTLKSSIFWQIALVYVCSYLVITSVLTHNMPYLGSIGMDRLTASMVAGAVPIFTIAGRVGFGWLGNKFNKKRLFMTTFFLVALGVLCYSYIGVVGVWLVFPFLLLFGLGYGGLVPMMPVLVREYFSTRHFGATVGFVLGIMTIGQLLGPPIAGKVFDIYSSYQGIWLAFAILMFISIAGIVTLPPTDKKDRYV